MGILDTLYNFFFGGPNPKPVPFKENRWKVESFEELDPTYREEVVQKVTTLISSLPFYADVADIELCGSYAFGCAQLPSDMDFNVALTNWELQNQIKEQFYNPLTEKPEWMHTFIKDLYKLRDELQLVIDIGFATCDQKEYNIVYSFRDQRFYNKEWGQKIRTKRKWDSAQNRYVEAPYRIRKFQMDPTSYA